MNSSLTVLLVTNKTGSNMSSLFTNDNILGWVSSEGIQKKDLSIIKIYGSFKVPMNMVDKHTDKYRDKRNFYTRVFDK